jgi:hypothetical protein
MEILIDANTEIALSVKLIERVMEKFMEKTPYEREDLVAEYIGFCNAIKLAAKKFNKEIE